jgi:hypothetical protein
VISVDTKKKELVGNFKNGGREWQPKGVPDLVDVHDFPSDATGKAIPYGAYDLAGNDGFVNVCTDHDTPVFAVTTIDAWWKPGRLGTSGRSDQSTENTARMLVDMRNQLKVKYRGLSPASLNRPFATLMPAFDKEERSQAEIVAGQLITRGCVEFCSVGPEAEQLHDSIDELIARIEALEVVTTWHSDYSDASEYFLSAAGGRSSTLLALVVSHPELVALLETDAGNLPRSR